MTTTPATAPTGRAPSCDHPQPGPDQSPVEPVDNTPEKSTDRRISPLAQVLVLPVLAYRRWISPALPPRCRFYPTCSSYAIEALRVHGAIRGIGLAVWRLLRCHPFHPGGYEPVPARKREKRASNSQTDGAARWIST